MVSQKLQSVWAAARTQTHDVRTHLCSSSAGGQTQPASVLGIMVGAGRKMKGTMSLPFRKQRGSPGFKQRESQQQWSRVDLGVPAIPPHGPMSRHETHRHLNVIILNRSDLWHFRKEADHASIPPPSITHYLTIILPFLISKQAFEARSWTHLLSNTMWRESILFSLAEPTSISFVIREVRVRKRICCC